MQPEACRAEPSDGRGQGGRPQSADQQGDNVDFILSVKVATESGGRTWCDSVF